MKRNIIIIGSIAIFILAFYYFKNIHGWMEFRKNTDTPNQFLNKTINKKENYTKDSSMLVHELKKLLLRHEHGDFFYSKEYFEGTDIIIDTIVYSPDLEKLGILVLTKNSTTRQIMPDKTTMWYYNAASYLGLRQGDTISLSLLGPIFTNYTNKTELSDEIRQACFRTFVSTDTTVKYVHKYNLNDIRFWTSSIWRKIEEDRINRKEFEEEKIKHPENVYEPQK